MRLTCPNCAATYDLPEDRVPAGGSHVQCSACHTRWFARPASAPERLSEDEIITRLETRAARPRLAAEGPPPRPPEEMPAPRPDHGSPEPQPERKTPALRPAEVAPELRAVEEAPASWTQAPAPVLFPAERPAHLAEGNREGPPPTPPTPLRPRQGERFETLAPTRPARPAQEPARPPSPRRGRFASGLLLALFLAGAGLGAYLRPGEVTARAPAAAPMLGDYAGRVDAAREWIEARLGPLRDRLTAR